MTIAVVMFRLHTLALTLCMNKVVLINSQLYEPGAQLMIVEI